MEHISWSLVRVLGTILVMGPPVAYYVYRDRTKHGKDHPFIWALGLGILGIAGLLVYLHRRGDVAPPPD